MKPILAAVVAVTAVAVSARQGVADAVAYSCQQDVSTNVTPLTRSGACTGFTLRDSAGKVKKRVEFGFLASGVLLSSTDGNTVVMVQSWLYGSMGSDGLIETYGGKTRTRDPIALLVYRAGKRVAACKLSQLVYRNRLVSLSTSHVQWLARETQLAGPLDKTLTFTTTSFRTVTIDLETGKLEAVDSALWKRCTVIAYGRVQKHESAYRMDPAYLAKGDARPHLDFSAAATVPVDQGTYATLCLETLKGKLVATEKVDVILNGLTWP